jgi:hypothetical protein
MDNTPGRPYSAGEETDLMRPWIKAMPRLTQPTTFLVCILQKKIASWKHSVTNQ